MFSHYKTLQFMVYVIAKLIYIENKDVILLLIWASLCYVNFCSGNTETQKMEKQALRNIQMRGTTKSSLHILMIASKRRM